MRRTLGYNRTTQIYHRVKSLESDLANGRIGARVEKVLSVLEIPAMSVAKMEMLKTAKKTEIAMQQMLAGSL